MKYPTPFTLHRTSRFTWLGTLSVGASLAVGCSDDDSAPYQPSEAGADTAADAGTTATTSKPSSTSTHTKADGGTSSVPELEAGATVVDGSGEGGLAPDAGQYPEPGRDAGSVDTSTSSGTTSSAPTVESSSTSTETDSGPTSLGSDDDAGALDDAGDASTFDDAGDASNGANDASTDAGDGASYDASHNDGGDGGAPELRVATLSELTDQSATDYANNEHGLIEGSRLAQWLDDWQQERPAEIEGRLVILQIVPSGVSTEVHVSANEAEGVYTYLVPASEFNTQRNTGLSAFETDIPDGAAADAWLAKYAIDPRKDFVLLTFEDQTATTNTVVHSIGRAWMFLKYWGVAKEHVGILNGSVNWNNTNEDVPLSDFADADYSTPPNDGTVTVRDLGVDATITSISLEEIIAILNQEDGAPDLEEVRIVDARGGAEALGLSKATSTGRTDCASYTGTAPNAKCSTPFEGRIKGARSVPWSQFLDSKANGFRFLAYDQLKTAFDEQANWDEDAEWTIQYCRTNQRSTVTGIVANVILGYPTRLYETSFIEWGHVATGVVADNFPFRTDLATLTEHAELHADDLAAYTPGGTLGTLTNEVTWVDGPNYNDEDDISPASLEPWPSNPEGWPRIDPDATTTRLSIDTDRAYLRGVDVDDLD